LADQGATMTAPARPALNGDLLALLAAAAGDGKAGLVARRAALARYEAAPAPDRVQHLWRFTDPAKLLPVAITAAAAGPAPVAAAPVPGATATIDLWPGRAPIVALAAGVGEGALQVLPVAATVLGADVFAALNDAAWNTGVALVVADGVKLPGPIHVRVHATAAALPRLQLAVGRGAEAVLVEQHLGGGADARVASRTEIAAAKGAHVRHALLQVWEPGTSGHLTVRTIAAADADVLTVCGVFGGQDAKLELGTVLAGAGAHSEIVGVTLIAGTQHADVHTSHRHEADRTSSRIDFKAVAADRARSTYTGLIRIEEHARHCEAYQENRNLLLSDRARADAIPELEIHNQEVSCSHGATIAPVDDDQLFYLESRGLDPSAAVGLVVGGFLENTLARLPEDTRAMVETFVSPRLATIREKSA
jgi:Fe-S cluster assembly protein SufD